MNFGIIIALSLIVGAVGWYLITIIEEKAEAKAKEAKETAVEPAPKIDEIEPYTDPLPAWPTWKNEKITKFWHDYYYFDNISNISNIYEQVIAEILTALDDHGGRPHTTNPNFSHITLTDHSLLVAETLFKIALKDSKVSLPKRRIYECLIVGLYQNFESVLGRRGVPLVVLPTGEEVKDAIKSHELDHFSGDLAGFAQLAEREVKNSYDAELAKKQEQQPLPEKTGGKPTKSKSIYWCNPKNPKKMLAEWKENKFLTALKLKIGKVVIVKYKRVWLSCPEGKLIWFQQDAIFEAIQEVSGYAPELDIPSENIELRIQWIYGALRACGKSCINWEMLGTPGFSATRCIVDEGHRTDKPWLIPFNAAWFAVSEADLDLNFKKEDLRSLVKSITHAPPEKKGGPSNA